MLTGKKIILAVTGSIAAYKAVLLLRILTKAGAEVQVLMTAGARQFVSPLTFSALSGRPVLSDFETHDGTGQWHNHVHLALWADVMVIAPASANTLSKMAAGLCDNFLMAVYLSAKCPVAAAPAMDLDMYAHAATQRALATLAADGLTLFDAPAGSLASGLSGKGRMAEPEDIAQALEAMLAPPGTLLGKDVLVTAGPTHEYLDPVRFIGNHSSGKMGFAIALEAARRGAQVHVVHGPVTAPLPVHPGLRLYAVTSADEMLTAVDRIYPGIHAAVFTAAVADYAPIRQESQKIKKTNGQMLLELKRNPDIAALMGSRKRADQINVGFALETENGLPNARKKLESKNFDLVVLNTLADEGAGFGHDTNKVTLLGPGTPPASLPLMSKTNVAKAIADALEKLLASSSGKAQ